MQKLNILSLERETMTQQNNTLLPDNSIMILKRNQIENAVDLSQSLDVIEYLIQQIYDEIATSRVALEKIGITEKIITAVDLARRHKNTLTR